MDIREVIEKSAEHAVNKAIKELEKKKMIKQKNINSFKKTEKILFVYKNLNDKDETKKRIKDALDTIKDDDYYGIIEEYFFFNLTFERISEIYDVNYRTISKQRIRLVNKLAQELFPNEVIKEILDN